MGGGTATGPGIFLPKGVFITLDGTDGTGKATQVRRLFEWLMLEGYACEKISFPAYDTFHGRIIREILDGKQPKPKPYPFGLFYANNRKDIDPKSGKGNDELIKTWLADRRLVIGDRYSEANFAYQGARVEEERERKQLITRLFNLEYVTYKLPKPDLVLLADMPIELAVIDGEKDVNEKNLDYQQKVREVYNWLFEHHKDKEFGYKKWEKIDCAMGGRRLTEEEVGDKIYKVVKEILPQ